MALADRTPITSVPEVARMAIFAIDRTDVIDRMLWEAVPSGGFRQKRENRGQKLLTFTCGYGILTFAASRETLMHVKT